MTRKQRIKKLVQRVHGLTRIFPRIERTPEMRKVLAERARKIRRIGHRKPPAGWYG